MSEMFESARTALTLGVLKDVSGWVSWHGDNVRNPGAQDSVQQP